MMVSGKLNKIDAELYAFLKFFLAAPLRNYLKK